MWIEQEIDKDKAKVLLLCYGRLAVMSDMDDEGVLS
jgi:hypothetical protein